MATITKPQRAVLLRMLEGWALAQSTRYDASAPWLQREGVGKGGQTERTNANTVHALFTREWIKPKNNRFPVRELELTDEGRRVATELKAHELHDAHMEHLV